MHKIYTFTVFFLITKDHLQYVNSNIKVLIKSYTSNRNFLQ